MTETLCTSGSVKLHAGANVSTAITAANYTEFINQAEGEVCMETKINWVDIYSTLDADVKKVLEMATATLAANFCIKYDQNTYLSPSESQTIMDANNYYYEKALSKLKEDQFSRFIRRGTNQ